jgi:hypothetical protein
MRGMRTTAGLWLCSGALTLPLVIEAQRGAGEWPQHSMERPKPPVVRPGAPALPVPPPADAIVLFDGKDLSKWQDAQGNAARWKVADGAFEVVSGTGSVVTRAAFGDVQLHIEWMAPAPARGEGQDRGNSGVFLMGKYELQILDSYNNVTYADGQAGAIYGQFPPLVNASRPPGEWQSYDVVFHRPRFDASGKVVSPARFTVLHNGVLIQDNVALVGPTANMRQPPYEAHADKLPLSLQDHGHAVRFRNVWVRALE